MRKSQQYGQPAATVTQWRAPAAGELVACTELWLTRRGDPNDHVLHPGERLRLDRGDDIVIEALQRAPAPLWRWQPAARPAMGWSEWLPRSARSAKPVLRPASCPPA